MADVHGRNYTKLAQEFPIDKIDPHIQFDEESHTYTVHGQAVPRSATKVISDAVGDKPFDADLVIARNLASWKKNPASKYGKMISGLDEDAAKAKIKDLWSKSSVLGTTLHRRFEASLNEATEPDDGQTDTEWRMVEKAVVPKQALGWIPRRTELSLWWEREPDRKVVCAGQLDALFTDAQDELVIVDLKRTDHNLSPNAPSFGKTFKSDVLSGVELTDYNKYSLQTSIYCVMIEQRTGLSTPTKNRFLLQAHPSIDEAKWIECRNFDAEARALLNALSALD